MTSFIRNAWYAAAWGSELAQQPLARTLLGEDIVLFRTADGRAIALEDRCPHRFAPLSLGRVHGDALQCGYHGLGFGPTGACTHNPHGEVTASLNKVKTFPVVERHSVIWLWPGDPALAQPDAIPDFSHLDAPGTRTLTGQNVTAAHYELVIDNLLDLTHTEFVHANFLESGMLKAARTLTQEGQRLYLTYRCPPGKAPPMMGRHLQDPDTLIEHWFDVRWDAPGAIQLRTGLQAVGSDDLGLQNTGTHLVTPETATSSHYFYAATRTYQLDDTELDERVKEWQRIGFGEQDKPMIEAVQRAMLKTRADGTPGSTDLMALRPLLLPQDAGAVRARRMLKEMLEREAR